MLLIADTGGLITAFNRFSSNNAAAQEALFAASVAVVTPLVMLEVEHIMTRDFGRQAAYSVTDWLLKSAQQQRVVVPEIPVATLQEARMVQNRYADLDLDLTDAVNVVVAQRYRTNRLLTIDERDFRGIRPLSHHEAFHLLPADGPGG
ncbi:PIN domain-containing protein [Nesterenkonia sp. MY13]|uniref:PIN domain-containing protein n=1 Tax=Nesterenkonia sedimenti TaxID=1463632 RepID=A0A7X8YEC5_9MICC|nr:PIN domain-containing protein [Nesterenkonia sedimenti]NLS10494.1 PIN domain-containing protein [Nesterenkonia sedimenti]